MLETLTSKEGAASSHVELSECSFMRRDFGTSSKDMMENSIICLHSDIAINDHGSGAANNRSPNGLD